MKQPFTYYSRAEFPGKTEKQKSEMIQQLHDTTYKGKLYFVIDGRGNSTTGHFMSLVKKHNLGPIVGEELGSNQFCSAGRKRCRLKNTKLEYSVANNTHVSTATNLPDEVGILPDHYVTQSIDDYIDGTDAIKQFTIDLIAEQIDWTPASPYQSSYFLEVDNSWQKELFRIPLNFAPGITLRGIEDARFPAAWREPDSTIFWSYFFAWNVSHEEALTPVEMNSNLELYFDGLMRLEQRSKEYDVPLTRSNIRKAESNNNSMRYTGTVETFDGFFKKEPMTFNVVAEQQFCNKIKRAMVIFRFSPQPTTSSVWDKLGQVKLPSDICKL